MNPKIGFLSSFCAMTERFWTPENLDLARSFGFEVALPAAYSASASGDLAAPDWAVWLDECDAAITIRGSPHYGRELVKRAPQLRIIGQAAGSVVAITVSMRSNRHFRQPGSIYTVRCSDTSPITLKRLPKHTAGVSQRFRGDRRVSGTTAWKEYGNLIWACHSFYP